MNKLQHEQESVSQQVDMIMKNRLRRFKFLLATGHTDDALAIADEFYEWMDLDQLQDANAINYFNLDDLTAL
tara:strand:+ start:421 stop:636 length:216 start_codon:yes stop_codon:yes gene_type:complete